MGIIEVHGITSDWNRTTFALNNEKLMRNSVSTLRMSYVLFFCAEILEKYSVQAPKLDLNKWKYSFFLDTCTYFCCQEPGWNTYAQDEFNIFKRKGIFKKLQMVNFMKEN